MLGAHILSVNYFNLLVAATSNVTIHKYLFIFDLLFQTILMPFFLFFKWKLKCTTAVCQRCLITVNEFPQLPDFLTPLSLLTFGRPPLFNKIASKPQFLQRQTVVSFHYQHNCINVEETSKAYMCTTDSRASDVCAFKLVGKAKRKMINMHNNK